MTSIEEQLANTQKLGAGLLVTLFLVFVILVPFQRNAGEKAGIYALQRCLEYGGPRHNPKSFSSRELDRCVRSLISNM
jgi:hypothetical protein